MHLTSTVAAVTVAFVLSSSGSPASAAAKGTESRLVIDGLLETPAPSPPVPLKPIRDKSERSRLMSLIKSGPITPPLLFPLSPPGLASRDFDCEVSTESVHLRRSSNYKSIGAKPKTTCSRVVQLILHTTTLKYSRDGKWAAVLPQYSDSQQDSSIHISLGIEHPCMSTRQTMWTAETVSYVFDRGQIYRGLARALPRTIACGR